MAFHFNEIQKSMPLLPPIKKYFISVATLLAGNVLEAKGLALKATGQIEKVYLIFLTLKGSSSLLTAVSLIATLSYIALLSNNIILLNPCCQICKCTLAKKSLQENLLLRF